MPAKNNQAPGFFLTTGEAALTLRKRLALNQSEFWNRIAVTQSGGSRYESGRSLPPPVRLLLHLAYSPERQALAMLRHLRTEPPQGPPQRTDVRT